MFICDISVFNKYGKQKLDEILRPLQLDWRELVVIIALEQVPGISQTRLIPLLQTDRANVTKLLQEMEKKALIRRETDETDKRNKACFLTTLGARTTPRLHEALGLWEAACFQGISKEDLLQFQRTSARITQNLVPELKGGL